jgi:hypothetical protein
MAQCFELSLLPGTDPTAFETFLWKEVFPKFTVLRRNVHGQEHRLLKLDDPGSSPRYVWLVFVTLFGSTPETSSKGPTVLASGLDWTAKIATIVKPYATVAGFSEIKLDEVAGVG